MVILKFETVGTLVSFIKKSLYMTDSSAMKKIVKWQLNKQITRADGDYLVRLPEKSNVDKEFSSSMLKKYNRWIKSGMKITLESQEPSQ